MQVGKALARRSIAVGLLSAALAGVGAFSTLPAMAADVLAGLKSSCQTRHSADAGPAKAVDFRICAAMIPSFDGTPLDATLTLPATAPRRRLPLVVFLHGFLDSKREYLSDTRSGLGADRGGAAYKTVNWNNIWFASRGYAVLNYSARGNGESGGQFGLASKNIEVRDTRHLTGLLADDAGSERPLVRIDPTKIGVIGSSYGGGQAWLVMTTRGDPRLRYGEWRSPGGRLLRLAALVPGYAWTDLLYTLAPNGHHRSDRVVDPERADTPFGIGKLTITDGLLATSAMKLPTEAAVWVARLNAGEPYDSPSDPVIPEAKRALSQDRSAYFQEGYFKALRARRQFRVPVLAGQGWTDPIFPAIEAVRMYVRLRTVSPGYPIGLYLGDFEHLTAMVKIPDLRHFHYLGNRLLDRFLRGRGRRPAFHVESALTSCEPGRFGPISVARSWASLAPAMASFDLGGPRQTASPIPDVRGVAADPVVVSQQRRGCITATGPSSPGVATYEVPVTRNLTLVGMPRLRLGYRTSAPDIQLNSRLWDVAPNGTQTLVTRGAYRAVNPNPAGDVADYELFGNAWRFEQGHTILVEVTQSDAGYLRPDNFPSIATIESARLVLPLRL